MLLLLVESAPFAWVGLKCGSGIRRAGEDACPCEKNETISIFAVGATLAVARKPSPGGRTIPPIRGKWPKAKRGREARPKVVTDEGALVAHAPRSSHGQLPAATQGRHTGTPLLPHRQNED